MACAPCPMDTIAMTAPTPMMIPSIVSAVLNLLRLRARTATLRIASKFIFIVVLSLGRKLHQDFPGILPVFYGKVSPDAAIAKLNNPIRVLGNVGLVRHYDDGEVSVPVEALENLHHFDRSPAIQCPRRLIGKNERGIVHQSAC